MAVGVKEDHNEEGGDPSETGTADDFSGVFGNPGDEAGLAQRRGERHEAAHPEHGVVGPFSERMSCHERTLAISMIAMASMAIGVAPRCVQLPVAQSTRHMTKTKASTFSSFDIGPMAASSFPRVRVHWEWL